MRHSGRKTMRSDARAGSGDQFRLSIIIIPTAKKEEAIEHDLDRLANGRANAQ